MTHNCQAKALWSSLWLLDVTQMQFLTLLRQTRHFLFLWAKRTRIIFLWSFPGPQLFLTSKFAFPAGSNRWIILNFLRKAKGLITFDLSLSSVAKMRHGFAWGPRRQGRKVLNLIEKLVLNASLRGFIYF